MVFLGSIGALLSVGCRVFVPFCEGESPSVVRLMALARTRVFSFLIGFLGLLFRLFGLRSLWSMV